MKKILQRESSVLRELASEVNLNDIQSAKIKKILEEMKDALDSQDDGVAIAAPQIGYSLRIFMISGKVEGIMKKKSDEEIVNARKNGVYKDLVFINPVIKKISKEKRCVEEGCLSVRYLYGQVERSLKATIEAYDEFGKKFTRPGTGLVAQIFQHETDHLNGVLFIDKAINVEEIPPETKRRENKV